MLNENKTTLNISPEAYKSNFKLKIPLHAYDPRKFLEFIHE